MKQGMEAINSLIDEHYEEYKNFTRLLLTLSVAFITFVTSTKTNATDPYSLFQKVTIIVHCASILFGAWLQYILVTSPLSDLKNYMDRIQDRTEKEKHDGGIVYRPPSFIQRSLFALQVLSFVLAFSPKNWTPTPQKRTNRTGHPHSISELSQATEQDTQATEQDTHTPSVN